MARPRAADDFAAIRARMEELRRERLQAAADHEIQSSNGAGRSPRNRASAKLGSWSSGRFDDRPDPLEAPRLSYRANHQRCGRAWVGLLLDNRCG